MNRSGLFIHAPASAPEGNDDGSTVMMITTMTDAGDGSGNWEDVHARLSVHDVAPVTTRSGRRSGAVDANDVADRRAAERAVTAALAAPLLDRAGIAHAHVTAHVQHAVDTPLVANGALARLTGQCRLQALTPLLQVGRSVRVRRQGAVQTLVSDRVHVRGRAGAGHGASERRRGLSGGTRMWHRRGRHCGRQMH